ncbi:MAG: hypothetical protein U0326_17670 [Polyangiales bacterium]
MKRLLSRSAIAMLALAVTSSGVPGCAEDPPPTFAWQTMLSGLPGAALSVWGTSAQNVYVVGGDALDGSGPYALHFDGQRWSRLNTGLRDGTLWWVHGVAPNAVFMAGTGGTVLRYDPTTNRAERMTTPGNATLFGVWGASANDVWAVGGDVNASTGVLWHYNGTAWTNETIPSGLGGQVILYKVWGTAANDAWVVGSNGTTLHYNGSAWSQVSIPTTARGPLFTVHGAGALRVAVGGNASGILLENSGNDWRQVELDGAPRLAGVHVPASGAALAVGSQGSVFLRHNGSWRAVARPPHTELEFHGAWIEPGTGAVWAVGGQTQATPLTDGIVYRFGVGLTPMQGIVTPPEITACPDARGTICTVMGNGTGGFNGDGHAVRASSLAWPMDLEFAPDGTTYLLDWNNHRVRRVTAAGTFETVIGTDLPGDGPADMGDLMEPGAPGPTVSLNHPTDLLFMRDGRMMMVSWHNHKLRRFDPATGRVYVLLGRGPGAQGDGMPWTSPDARLKQPSKAVYDAQGNLYILDQGNGKIRRVDAAGTLSTIAGDGMRGYMGDGGPAAMARFNWQSGENPEPQGGLAMGPDGKLYIADSENCRIRRIDLTTMTIETVAGDGMCRFGGDDGPGPMASFNVPQDIEFGPDGNLYIADTNNHRIRTFDPRTGIVRTLAGTGTRGYSGDRGPAAMAQLWRPYGMAFDRNGDLFVCDTYNNRVRRIQLHGAM